MKKTDKKFYETDEFKKLEKIWNKKLSESGFKDTESIEERELDKITKQEFTVNHQQIDYFRDCRTYLTSGKITDKLDLFIFEQHVDGRSNVEIQTLIVDINKTLKRGEKLKELDRRNIDRRLIKILNTANIEPFKFNL
jgi:hypothetical protein